MYWYPVGGSRAAVPGWAYCGDGGLYTVPGGVVFASDRIFTVTPQGVSPRSLPRVTSEAVGIAVEPIQFLVRAAYEDFLGRAGVMPEWAVHVRSIVTRVVDRAGFARSIATSDEGLSRFVTGLYRTSLGREPDPSGLAGWVSLLRSGRVSVSQAVASFYASAESFAGRGGGTGASWVSLLYAELLGRQPDAAGLQFWVAAAQDPARGRYWVADALYGSAESRQRRVAAVYQALLGRGPDPAGALYWTSALQRVDDLALQIAVASSEEYLNRARSR